MKSINGRQEIENFTRNRQVAEAVPSIAPVTDGNGQRKWNLEPDRPG
jgi:hypothetical protein